MTTVALQSEAPPGRVGARPRDFGGPCVNTNDRDGVLARLLAHAVVGYGGTGPGGSECWVWIARVNSQGYGRVRVGVREANAHRAVFESVRGAVQAGLVLDHLCRNRACVNPDHLEPVTCSENVRRGYLSRGVCHNGHAVPSDAPVIFGHRRCRVCVREREKRKYRRQMATDSGREARRLRAARANKRRWQRAVGAALSNKTEVRDA